MTNITYLVGAGASANQIPCVKNFSQQLPDAISYFRKHKDVILKYAEERNHHPRMMEFYRKDYDNLLSEVEFIAEQAKEYSTIDTYAKYLYLTDQYRYVGLLSLLLGISLIYFQRNGSDYRYDNFWASILDFDVPENVKIISWNYDNQLENSFLKFSKLKDIVEAQARLKVFPSASFSIDSDYRNNSFSIIKLNGTIAKYNGQTLRYECLASNCNESGTHESFLRLLIEYTSSITSHSAKRIISVGYAWDQIGSHDATSTHLAKKVACDTEILIVLGYSFPFFNRKIDREILNSFSKLRKIYIQDLYPNNILSRLKSIVPQINNQSLEIALIDDVAQFFIPYEY